MTRQSRIKIGNFEVGNDLPLAIIAGPCQMESLDHAMDMAGQLHEMTSKLGMGLVYKSSFDKANRTSIHTKRGLGMEKALSVFESVKKEFNVPVLTDVHEPDHCAEAASVVDVLQIPAFLCRQTNLLVAAAKTGKVVNIKKGQFLAPWDMKNVAEKMVESGNNQVMLTDRGTSFGYNTLVSDMRGLPTMAETGFPVVFDATHSVQQPGGQGATTGGQREFVPVLARAAVSVGVAMVFMETHEDPDNAPSDGPTMMKIDAMEKLLGDLQKFDAISKTL